MLRDMLPPFVDITHQAHEPEDRKARLAAGVLTSVIYGGFALLLWLHELQLTGTPAPRTIETYAIVLHDVPKQTITQPPPPFLAHLIRPKAEVLAPPSFTVASTAPVARAELPATAATSSPMAGGAPQGTGSAGQAVSANGANGNGTGTAGCLDPVWMRAVTARVGRFYYYPSAALAQHTMGVVMVHFDVTRDGRLDMLEIGKSSGDDSLDDAAYSMFRKAQPLPAIPARMHVDHVDGIMPIIFGKADQHFSATPGHCSGS